MGKRMKEFIHQMFKCYGMNISRLATVLAIFSGKNCITVFAVG